MKIEEKVWGTGSNEGKCQGGSSFLSSPLSGLSRYIRFLLSAKLDAQDKTSAEFLKLCFIVPYVPLAPACEINRGKEYSPYRE